jgi:2-amino-4-hydroxy-6-hydroxymethyldihydropteridine diphosphokinase
MERCFIALGGNVGRVEATFDRALKRLDATPGLRVGAVSLVHKTAPVGSAAGAAFRNAAAELLCGLPPLDLLDALQAAEAEFGRRREIHWGPRTLDLDVIFYGDQIIHEPRLRVPHPAGWYRRFVLDPLAEIAAEVIHPEKGLSVRDLRARLLVRPLTMRLAGGDAALRLSLISAVQAAFPNGADVDVGEWDARGDVDAVRPTFVAWLGNEARFSKGRPEFESLPRIPRLEVPVTNPATFLEDVLESALAH